MAQIAFDTKTLSPWADISRILGNLKSLEIVAGGTKYTGPAVLQEVDGHATLTIGPKAPKRVSAPAKDSKDPRGKK